MTDNNINPFVYFASDELGKSGEYSKHFTAALSLLDAGKSRDKLLNLLNSSNDFVASDALHISAELKQPPCWVLNDALRHVVHPEWDARFYLSDIVLRCTSSLTLKQLSKVLLLADDEQAEVRCKAMEIIFRLDSQMIGDVICGKLDIPDIRNHERGFEIISREKFTSDDFDSVFEWGNSIEICYAGARLIKAWGANHTNKKYLYEGPIEEKKFLAWKLKMIKRYNDI